MQTALDKLHKFFGHSSLVIEAHISDITRKEVVKWSVDSFQSFVNELEDIKTLFTDNDQIAMMNSPGVLKKIISRLPKPTRDKLAESLCDSNIIMPSFDYLLKFVENQLKLVSHPLMQCDIVDRKTRSDTYTVFTEKKQPAKFNRQFEVKSYSQSANLGLFFHSRF